MKRSIVFLSLCASVWLTGCQGQMASDVSSSDSASALSPDSTISFDSSKPSSESNDSRIPELNISTNGFIFEAEIENTPTSEALISMLPMTLRMSAMAHEKYFYLDTTLPTDPYKPEKIETGDIMLYGNNCLVLFYESFETSYSYTRIGKIKNTASLAEALGDGSVEVEWEASF